MSSSDPYVRAGLRHNPFILEPEGVLADTLFADLNRNPHACPVPQSATAFELVGPCGAGKSTQLLRWRKLHPGPYVHVSEDWRRWRGLPVGPICYWDEAYRVPAVLLRHALATARRQHATVVIAGHISIAKQIRASKLALVQHEFPTLTAAAVQAFFDRRVVASAVAGVTPRFALPVTDAEQLARDAGASVRALSDALHIWMAQAVAR